MKANGMEWGRKFLKNSLDIALATLPYNNEKHPGSNLGSFAEFHGSCLVFEIDRQTDR